MLTPSSVRFERAVERKSCGVKCLTPSSLLHSLLSATAMVSSAMCVCLPALDGNTYLEPLQFFKPAHDSWG